MPCSYITPAKGHQKPKPCKNPETKGGFCAMHQPAPVSVAVTSVTPNWIPHVSSGATTPNANFAAACAAMSDQIDKYCQNGPIGGGQTFKGKTGNKNGAFTLHHETQPRANNTFFYNWVGTTMHVYAAGGHSGNTNTKYSLTWFDGNSATIDLKKSSIV